MKHTIVIIGSGMASYMLAIQLRSQSAEVDIAVVTETDGRYYPKPMLSSALYHKKDPKAITTADHQQMADKYQIKIYTRCHISSIDTSQKEIQTAQGDTIGYDKLVLATGSSPRKLKLPQGGEQLMHQVNTIEDYEAFLAAIDKKKRIAVIGTGLVGIEFAHDLRHEGYEVQVFSETENALHGLVPDSVGNVLKQHLLSMGVVWHTQVVTGIVEKGNGLQITAGAEKHECDVVLAAVGILPRIELAQATGLLCSHGIEVDQTLQTSHNDIYALGDCAKVLDLHMTYVAPIKQQAKALAETLTGKPTKVSYPAMPVVVKTPTFPLTLVPLRGKVSGAWHPVTQEKPDGVVEVFYNDDKVVQGFVLAGKATVQRNTWLAQMPNLLDV